MGWRAKRCLDALVWVCGLGIVAADLLGIPTVPYNSPVGAGKYLLHDVQSIVVDARYANARDEGGETLIPPSLFEFATTFAGDLAVTQQIQVPVVNDTYSAQNNVVFLTLGDASGYLDAAGRISSEGYTLTTNSSGIFITGASPLGVWWGTRTVLQQAVLNNGLVAFGTGTDTPGWPTRGMMLDAGRHFYPKDYLMEMCAYMSYFKQNTFHVHLSDNLVPRLYSVEQNMELYARIRLWSDLPAVEGLNLHPNESYTRAEFDEIQTSCAARGVTILPEIETPGHALVMTQWKPEIALYRGYYPDLSLLNLSHPDALPTVETIWETFLPWFHSRTVHIGADEYDGPKNEYIAFVNELAAYLEAVGSKQIRIWGTFPPVLGVNQADFLDNNIYTNVSIQHWEFYEDQPVRDFIDNNYTVVNSNDNFYVVNKWGGYPSHINASATFTGNPADGNGFWRPYCFSPINAQQNPAADNPFVLGAIAALWNDFGPNATVYLEAYYAWREGLPALADKQWGGNLTEPEFWDVLERLHPSIPGQNLDRSIPSVGETIVNYTLSDFGRASNGTYSSHGNAPPLVITDTSGNGYNASTDCYTTLDGTIALDGQCSIITPLSSKGRNYTLTVTLRVDSLADTSTGGQGGGYPTLLSGRDSQLVLTPNITFFASGNFYALGTELPLGEWLDLTLIGRGTQTFASVKIQESGQMLLDEWEFIIKMGILGYTYHDDVMGIEAPLHEIGGVGCGWTGEFGGMSLTGVA